MPQQKIVSLLVAFTSLIVVAMGCGSGSSGPPSPSGSFRTLRFTATSDKLVYTKGETASFVITANNVGSAPIRITSGSPFYSLQYHLASWVVVYSGSRIVRQNYIGPGFGDSVTIGAGSTEQGKRVWDLTDDDEVPVPPGKYTVITFVVANQIDGVTVTGNAYDLAAPPLSITIN